MILATVVCLGLIGDVLPGSNLSVKQAATSSELIVAAKVVKTGIQLGLGAVSVTSGVELSGLEFLKGRQPDGGLSNLSVSSQGNEKGPVVGDEYIFFMEKTDHGPKTVKMLRKTAENLEAVRSVLK